MNKIKSIEVVFPKIWLKYLKFTIFTPLDKLSDVEASLEHRQCENTLLKGRSCGKELVANPSVLLSCFMTQFILCFLFRFNDLNSDYFDPW